MVLFFKATRMLQASLAYVYGSDPCLGLAQGVLRCLRGSTASYQDVLILTEVRGGPEQAKIPSASVLVTFRKRDVTDVDILDAIDDLRDQIAGNDGN